MQLSPHEIVSILDRLGIKRKNKPSKDWLGIACPLPQHGSIDKVINNCSVNLKTGVIHCFACGSGHILTFAKNLDIKISEKPTALIKEEKPKPKKIYIEDNNYLFTHVPLIPNKFYYTVRRGFTQEFCNTFNIRHCLSDIYDDYMIIPIIDKNKNINEFEARKLKEYEILKFLYKSTASYERLKNSFRIKEKLKEFDIYENYLTKPKVLYLSDSRIKETLWNIDNLDFNNTLYIVEGVASIPKIYTHITKNVTSVFGSEVSEDQIEYLKQFKKIIVIPDNDPAGVHMIELLNLELRNFSVCNIQVEDTNPYYIEEIRKKKLQEPPKFIVKHFFKKK